MRHAINIFNFFVMVKMNKVTISCPLSIAPWNSLPYFMNQVWFSFALHCGSLAAITLDG